MGSGSRKAAAMMTAAAAMVALAGCGGGSGGTPKERWTSKNGSNVSTFSDDLDAAQSALTNGDRPTILRACNQLTADIKSFRPKALPVPNGAVDGPLRVAFDKSGSGADDCLAGSRVSDAAALERAIPTLREARASLTTAQDALTAWQ
ncbi:MAG: hypothetical protein ABR511_03580 [Acidimicrobiales bacterium]